MAWYRVRVALKVQQTSCSRLVPHSQRVALAGCGLCKGIVNPSQRTSCLTRQRANECDSRMFVLVDTLSFLVCTLCMTFTSRVQALYDCKAMGKSLTEDWIRSQLFAQEAVEAGGCSRDASALSIAQQPQLSSTSELQPEALYGQLPPSPLSSSAAAVEAQEGVDDDDDVGNCDGVMTARVLVTPSR